MRFKITHETEYTFSEPIFLEPHYLRFKPKNRPHLELESYIISLSLTTAGISEQLDAEDNPVHFCWFDGVHEKITITSEAVVLSKEYNPFNLLIYPLHLNTIPFSYPNELKPLVQRHLVVEALGHDLVQYGNSVLNSRKNDTLSFVTELNSTIYTDFILESREHGIPFQPDKTFRLKKGSCRDLAWMQIQLLRNLGIASRFVSGYYYVDVENPKYELHAWTEVFLPGAGWLGFDPSNGISTAHTHIAVAAGSHYRNTMPVSGTLRGTATSELSTNLTIDVLNR